MRLHEDSIYTHVCVCVHRNIQECGDVDSSCKRAVSTSDGQCTVVLRGVWDNLCLEGAPSLRGARGWQWVICRAVLLESAFRELGVSVWLAQLMSEFESLLDSCPLTSLGSAF